MMLYMQPMALEVEINFEAKVRAMVDHLVRFAIVSSVENHTIKAIAPHLGKSVASAERIIISRLYVSLAHLSTRETTVDIGLRQKEILERNFMKLMRMKVKL